MRSNEIDDVIGQVSRLVEEHYVFEDAAAAISKVLRAGTAAWQTDQLEPEELATLVTAELQSVNGDKHLRLRYSAEDLPDQDDEARMLAELTESAARNTGGVAKVERLEGNIGYLDLCPILYPLSVSAESLTAAFTILASTDALIIDLRSNRGGSPETVQFVCSYFFDESVHLNSIEERDGANLWQSWSLPYVPGRKFGGTKPVYVLTSATSFSGAEELAYNLQQRSRGLVIGETTMGGAHPCKSFRVHPRLAATIPFARSVHPESGTNWEGTGIQPDVKMPADQALDEAIRRAAQPVQPISAGR
ncbi:S41 family peptidase [Flindersiella endophytica]